MDKRTRHVGRHIDKERSQEGSFAGCDSDGNDVKKHHGHHPQLVQTIRIVF